MTPSLSGRTAIVTGASAGLGAHIARALAGAGARVGLVARRRERLTRLADDLPGAVVLAGDLGHPDDVDAIAAEALVQLGSVDILVNNAACVRVGPAETETADDIAQMFAVNVFGLVRLTQRLVQPMLDRGSGSIVNMTSVAAARGTSSPAQAAYAASKASVNALTRHWAAQWGARGIRVNAIAAGLFRSELTGDSIDTESVQRWIRRRTILQRSGEPEDIDGVILLLVGNGSSYVTGQIINVDGGWSTG
ncbi:glucose 1-dehydrogenase [Pseudonocardia ailaonensis]|uniref:Glucose 1-dehydrogenase n=1 Tax=Pseudonocardia ailaonensis TaxID=367279 RepID=A0ABN2NAR6_9PSEU